jgi:hypothetical protein
VVYHHVSDKLGCAGVEKLAEHWSGTKNDWALILQIIRNRYLEEYCTSADQRMFSLSFIKITSVVKD